MYAICGGMVFDELYICFLNGMLAPRKLGLKIPHDRTERSFQYQKTAQTILNINYGFIICY